MTAGEAGGGLGRRLARNTLHGASGRVVSLVVWLAITPSMLRALDSEGYGVWGLFYALTGWLASMDFGFSLAALRFVSGARTRGDDRGAGEYASLAILGYLGLGALWLVLVPLVREPLVEYLRIPGALRDGANLAFAAGAVVFALAGIANTTSAVLQAHDRFDLSNGVTLCVSLGQALGIAVAIERGAGLQGMIVATALAWAAGGLLGAALVRGFLPRFRWAAPIHALSRWSTTLRFGGPMQLANVLGVLHQQVVDKTLLTRMVALAAVAPYELGLRVATAASSFPQLLLVAMTPAAAALHARGDDAGLHALYLRSNRYVLSVAAVVTAGVIAAAPEFFRAWVGHADMDAVVALRGLSLAAYLGVAAAVAGAIARGVGRTELELEWAFVALAVHVSLGLLFVPTFGLRAAVLALLSGNLVGGAWFSGRLATVLRWPRARPVVEPLGIPMLACLGASSLADFAFRDANDPTPLAAWGRTVLVASLAGALAGAVLLGTRFLPWREVLQLLRPGPPRDDRGDRNGPAISEQSPS